MRLTRPREYVNHQTDYGYVHPTATKKRQEYCCSNFILNVAVKKF